MIVIKHDEGDNACSFDLDHEAWVMLVGFPEDLKNGVTIPKVVSGFGILVYWHETTNLARVVAKVYLNPNAKIPGSAKVNAGLPQRGRSWTLPCFVLKQKAMTLPREEEAYVTLGLLHPVPPQAPHWSAPGMPEGSRTTPAVSNVGLAMLVDVVVTADGCSTSPLMIKCVKMCMQMQS